MSEDDQPAGTEKVVRGLLRFPRELTGPYARLHQDIDDFIRRLEYRDTGLPENGISVFRMSKFASAADFYAKLKTKKPVGYAQCELSSLNALGLKHKVSGQNNEHVSLRCPDCNMIELAEGICKPTDKASFADCPLFDKSDPFELNKKFKEQEAPMARPAPQTF